MLLPDLEICLVFEAIKVLFSNSAACSSTDTPHKLMLLSTLTLWIVS